MTILPHAARLDAVAQTRGAAARTLERTLAQRGMGMSEAAVHAAWLAELRKEPDLQASGWYAPPPDGMSVLVGDPPDYARASFVSLRNPDKWARPDVLVNEESLIFTYCSPVHRETGMIGDFQMSIYGGSSAEVREHVAITLDATIKTVEYAVLGMELRELYNYATSQMRRNGVRNDTYSTTDVSGSQNIGHTIPWFDRGAPDNLLRTLADGEQKMVAANLSAARTFVTGEQRARIGLNSAFTVEPQVTSPSGILASFHFIVVFQDGYKTILAGFSKLFDRFNMTEFLLSESLATVRRYDS